MKFIDGDHVHQLLDFEGLIDALAQAHLGGRPKVSDRVIYNEENETGHPDSLIILPAWEPQEGVLCKLVTSFPNNRERHGLSNVNSIYVFNDGETGITKAVIDGEAMIFRKTSADSALGSRILSREDSETMLMIGAGALAPYLVRAHLSVRPSLKRVLVWNRTASNAGKLVEMLRGEGIPAEMVDSLDAAVPQADIICSATMASEPHLKGALLRPGTHVDLVGSFTPEMREADDDVLRRCTIFVDHRQTTDRSGEFTGPFERGVISSPDIEGDLFALCQQKILGRTGSEQVTMMKNGGGSHLDYYAAKYLVDKLNGHPFQTTCSS